MVKIVAERAGTLVGNNHHRRVGPIPATQHIWREMHTQPVEAPDWVPPSNDDLVETHFRESRVALLHGFQPSAEVYRTGQNSWSPAGWRLMSDAPLRIANPERRRTADDTMWDDPGRHHSSWVMALSAGSTTILLGALEADTPRLHADLDVLVGWTETGCEGSWVLIEGEELAAFSRYRELLATRYGVIDEEPGKIWSSWYSLYEDVSRSRLEEIMVELPGLGFDTVQVDDGWERAVGDWEANDKFPEGMADLARAAEARGLRPGLWLAPFIVLPDSEAFEEHRDMLLRDAAGELVPAGSNWGSNYFTYDYTREDACDLLAELIDVVVSKWGFTYLKLDFLQAAAAVGSRSREMDREAIYRRAITTIRETAGDSVYLLGSGALMMPSLGILNAVRTGPDVAPMWTNYATQDPSDALAHNALRNGVERMWMRHLVGLDPDVVFARGTRNLLTPEQRQWLRDSAVLSGFRAVSDPPEWLTEEEKEMLRNYLGPLPETERRGRYRFRIGEREVDLEHAVRATSGPYAL